MKTFAAALISTCKLADSCTLEIDGRMKGGISYGLKKTGLAAEEILTVQTTLKVGTMNEFSIIDSNSQLFLLRLLQV